MSKTRNQNPVVGDEICLKLYTQNSNNFANVFKIDHVDIIQENCTEKTCDNPEGNLLVETIDGTAVCHPDTGIYHLDLQTTGPKYTIGRYHDVWWVQFNEGDELAAVKQDFEIYPNLWVTSPTPVVYSFDFHFTPNRIRQGSKKWLIINIVPNVPRASDIERYYRNLAISADLKIYIEQNCGPCVPKEADLRLITDGELVTERDKVYSYYKLDTSELDCGLYNVWFELDYAGNTDISPKQQLLIYS